jgi:hypothetical protein
MTPVNAPTATLAQVLAAPAELRILHAAAPSINGDVVVATMGVDNIRAVPEPAHVLALALAAGGAARLVRRRRAAGGATPGSGERP